MVMLLTAIFQQQVKDKFALLSVSFNHTDLKKI